ncbi:DUF6585 family protein [Nocardia sp. NBC_01009]|uniref:DUF6585 family protein n=1 Tax=Nocardia sp. NBC_01009 TaxID=2975996 RepID=UPI00386B331D|nr:hypothetical protein OHA42_01710 [Nocardia sp. NBC_01009]
MTTPSTVTQGEAGTSLAQKVPLTQLIHLMAEYQKLGTHRQTFRPAAPARDNFVRGCGIVAGGFATVGAICAVVGAYPGSVAVSLLALVPASMAFVWGRRNRHNRAARLDLFESGMTVYRSGEQIAGFRWDSAEVRQQVIPFQSTAPSDYSFEMSGPGDAAAAFDDGLFDDAREWAKAIQSAITATQLPRAVIAIDEGATVNFGEISLHLGALIFRDKIFAWEQIQLIDARSGLVRMKVDGSWVSLTPVGRIPNFYIFNEIAERLRQAAAEELAARGSIAAEPAEAAAAPSADATAAQVEPPTAAAQVDPSTAAVQVEPTDAAPVAEQQPPRSPEITDDEEPDVTGSVNNPNKGKKKSTTGTARDNLNPVDLSTASN